MTVLGSAAVLVALLAVATAVDVAVGERYQVETPHTSYKPMHELSVKDGVALILDESLKPTAEELTLLVEGVQQPDLQALSITKMQIVLQGVMERFTHKDHHAMMALRSATQHIHGLALPLKPLGKGEEFEKPKHYHVPEGNANDLNLYSFVSNRQLHNKILQTMMGWFWIALAHPDNHQAAWKMGNLLHNLGDTFSAGHVERSESLRKGQVSSQSADPLKTKEASQLLGSLAEGSKQKQRRKPRFAELLRASESSSESNSTSSGSASSASSASASASSGSGSSLEDYVCGTEEINMFHSMDVANWNNHKAPDVVTTDFRFHCLKKHIAEMVQLWKAGRAEVSKLKREDQRLEAINRHVKKAAEYLCTKALRINQTRLLWPAGGQPAGMSSRSEITATAKIPFRLFKGDQPVLPLGLTTPKASAEFVNEVSHSVFSEDKTNKDAKTMYIHGFTYPKREEASYCLDPEFKKLLITGPYLEVIMKELSPKDHWVDFPGMGYRPDVSDAKVANHQLDSVSGSLDKWVRYLNDADRRAAFLDAARSVFHVFWQDNNPGSGSGGSSDGSSKKKKHKKKHKMMM